MQIVQISGAKTQPVVQRADGEYVRNNWGVGVLLVNEFSHPKDSVKEKYFRET